MTEVDRLRQYATRTATELRSVAWPLESINTTETVREPRKRLGIRVGEIQTTVHIPHALGWRLWTHDVEGAKVWESAVGGGPSKRGPLTNKWTITTHWWLAPTGEIIYFRHRDEYIPHGSRTHLQFEVGPGRASDEELRDADRAWKRHGPPPHTACMLEWGWSPIPDEYVQAWWAQQNLSTQKQAGRLSSRLTRLRKKAGTYKQPKGRPTR